MYINQIDNLYDKIINDFNSFLIKKDVFNNFAKDNNFVKFQNEITNIINEFMNKLNVKDIEKIIGNKKYISYILDIIKRYCAYYIYLGIAFNYEGDRELFITNIIESSKNNTLNINNFYNSDNNAKIIHFFQIIKDIIQLKEFKTIERIKIILANDPIKYFNTINLLNNIGDDFFNEYFLIDDNFHNIIKTLIFNFIYLNEEKNDIIKILNETDIADAEYKYIDIIQSKSDKLSDFTFLQSFISELYDNKYIKKDNTAADFYEFLETYKKESELFILTNAKIIDFLFSNKILIPVTEDFLRYNKNTEKYEKDFDSDIKERDATKIKYIINKVTKVMNLYSPAYITNPKLKQEALNLFYKSLEYKEAILYNDNEEVKIINKLELSENTTDLDYIIDLDNIRKYAFLNFKELSKEGFKLRIESMIQGIRYSNIKYMDTKSENRRIELRVGNSNLPLNVVGVVFNPSGRILECTSIKNLINIRTLNKNGFNGILDLFRDTTNKSRDLYYWLFDLKIDKIKLQQYKNVSSQNSKTVIENIMGELYNYYMIIKKKSIYKIILKLAPSNIWDLLRIYRHLLSSYKHSEYIANFFYNNIIDKYIIHNIYTIKPTVAKIIENRKIIKLKLSHMIKPKDTTIVLNTKITEIDSIYIINIPICIHYIKWDELNKIPRKNEALLNQTIFNFVKQYVKINERNEYICKSCSELLDLKKYVLEATYVPELDTFLTTSLVTNAKLNEIPKYAKYTRTIRNIEKNIEKICYAVGLNYYLGNTPVIKLRRKIIIKDVIDLILIHSEYLKKQPKDRITRAVENYNIHKDLTNLFFFELKDEVFLTSSLDTDYYKIIKFNNVIAYILLIIIIDLNIGMIISMKEDKRCNYFLYSKVGDMIFSKLFIRINENEKIAINNIPLLAYVLFYMSCILTNTNIWLWNNDNKMNMEYNIQKTIIHTVVDLINSLIEANMVKDKHFLYELIVNRLVYKIKNTYMDKNGLKLLDTNVKKMITLDTNTNKINYNIKKDIIISLDKGTYLKNNKKELYPIKEKCETKTTILDILPPIPFNYNIDVYTNCITGKFHEWDFKNDKLVCNLCDIVFDNIGLDNDGNISRVIELKMLILRKLANTYCINGDLHKIDMSTNICNKCNKNVNSYQYTKKELFEMEKNLINIGNTKAREQIETIKIYFDKKKEQLVSVQHIIIKNLELYSEKTDNNMVNYVDLFINILIKNIGEKIKIDGNTIYLRDTIYIIKNDYLGTSIKNNIIILSSENKIFTSYNHPFYKKDVIYYHDKHNNTFVFYNNITKNYIGYSKDNKTFYTYKSDSYIEIVSSVKDIILNFGLENKFFNIYHLSTEYKLPSKKRDPYTILKQIIRLRCNNIKQCIYRSISIIEKIKNTYNIPTIYNIKETLLLNEFQRSLKNFDTTNIFKNIYDITSNININNIDIKIDDNIMTKQYIDTSILMKLNNMDSKLLFYYLFNLHKLIDINTNPGIRISLCYMIIKLIIFCFNIYYIPIENNVLRKFDSVLSNESPYIDDKMQVSGYYMDLVNTQEIDDEAVKEITYDINEENKALDIDDFEKEDYEDNDDEGANEMLDNDNNE